MSAIPAFNRGFRLRRDEIRGAWVVLAPERLFLLDDPAAEILQLVDGHRSVADIAATLSEKYLAPLPQIAGDVDAMLQDLVAKGAIHLGEAPGLTPT